MKTKNKFSDLPLHGLKKPLKMFISYKVENINQRNLETYELEVLFKAGEPKTPSMHTLKKALEGFCTEAEGIMDILYKEDGEKL